MVLGTILQKQNSEFPVSPKKQNSLIYYFLLHLFNKSKWFSSHWFKREWTILLLKTIPSYWEMIDYSMFTIPWPISCVFTTILLSEAKQRFFSCHYSHDWNILLAVITTQIWGHPMGIASTRAVAQQANYIFTQQCTSLSGTGQARLWPNVKSCSSK